MAPKALNVRPRARPRRARRGRWRTRRALQIPALGDAAGAARRGSRAERLGGGPAREHRGAAAGVQERLRGRAHATSRRGALEQRAEQRLGGEEVGLAGGARARRAAPARRSAAPRARGVRRPGDRRSVPRPPRGRRRLTRTWRRRGRCARRCGAAASSSEPSSVGRMIDCSSDSGFSIRTTPRRGCSGPRRSRSSSAGSAKLQPTTSCRPRPTSASSAARRTRWAWVSRPPRHGERAAWRAAARGRRCARPPRSGRPRG